MKILIVHTYGLGDMIMATPAICSLCEAYPSAKIDYLVFQKHAAAPVRHCDRTEQIIYSGFEISAIMMALRSLRRIRYDIVMHTSGTAVWKIAPLMLLLGGKVKIGEFVGIKIPWYSFQNAKKPMMHRVEANLALVGNLAEKRVLKPRYCLPDQSAGDTLRWIRENGFAGKKLIGLHPGCNQAFVQRRWGVENYVSLIKRIRENMDGVAIVVFAGPDEIEEAVEIVRATENSKLYRDNIDNVAALISHLEIMVTNDSGLGHIASCFGVKTLTIFVYGSYATLERTRPWGENAYIADFRKSKPENEVERVFSLLEKAVDA
jgi:ADP-heptose:LPS heptosyltransferase